MYVYSGYVGCRNVSHKNREDKRAVVLNEFIVRYKHVLRKVVLFHMSNKGR
jgi:hypothetical protein